MSSWPVQRHNRIGLPVSSTGLTVHELKYNKPNWSNSQFTGPTSRISPEKMTKLLEVCYLNNHLYDNLWDKAIERESKNIM